MSGCLFVDQPDCRSLYRWYYCVRLSACLFVSLYICLHVCLSAYLSVSLNIGLYICLCVSLFVDQCVSRSVYLSLCLSVHLSISLTVSLCICLYACLSNCRSVCQSVCTHLSLNLGSTSFQSLYLGMGNQLYVSLLWSLWQIVHTISLTNTANARRPIGPILCMVVHFNLLRGPDLHVTRSGSGSSPRVVQPCFK